MIVGILLLASGIVAACGGDAAEGPAESDVPAGDAPAAEIPSDEGAAPPEAVTRKVALLLPESKTARYETQDRPNFERRLNQLCSDCEVLYSNANQHAAQQQQAEAALTNGAAVLVLDPVDTAAAASIVAQAKAQGVPVISYDRLILDADIDYYVSFDNEMVGLLQAQALLSRLRALDKAEGTIVMINGAPTEHDARLFKQGAHRVFDASGLTIGREFDTPDWSPDEAQREMEQAITALGPEAIDGVYCANDRMASGVIAAMKGAGRADLPPVTGQDADLAAIQRILVGEQYMTIYKAIRPEAEVAADLAFALLEGRAPSAGLVNGVVDNGLKEVAAVLLPPVTVTRELVADTVIADGLWTVDQLCTDEYAAACAEAGIGVD